MMFRVHPNHGQQMTAGKSRDFTATATAMTRRKTKHCQHRVRRIQLTRYTRSS